ncbi:MAG TPA: hypothetical protein VFE55_15120 [Acidimicrobiia bacterium]|nr:hypothetical protein [Acidimicrobiia bacterium]
MKRHRMYPAVAGVTSLAEATGDEVNANALRPTPLVEATDGGAFHLPPMGRPGRRRSWRGPFIGAVALAVVSAIGAVGYACWDRTTTHAGGPVLLSAGINGQRLAVGEPTNFHGVRLSNRADQPAVVERVRILGVTGGFEVLGVRVIPRQYGTGASDAIPAGPTGGAGLKRLGGEHVIPVSKARAGGAPDDGLELAIAARATVPGVARMRGIEITYRVGRRRYRRTGDAPLYLCAPPDRYSFENCPGEAENDFGHAVADFPVK